MFVHIFLLILIEAAVFTSKVLRKTVVILGVKVSYISMYTYKDGRISNFFQENNNERGIDKQLRGSSQVGGKPNEHLTK